MGLISTTVIATRPASIVAADNPIIIQLSTGTLGAAGYAKGKLKVLSTSTNNLTVTFNLTGQTSYNKVFTGKEYPNRDDFFLTQYLKNQNGTVIDSGITTSMIASSLADCLKKDILISNNYYVNYSGTTIIELIAKSPGTTFSLAGQVTSSNPSNLSFTSVSSGADQFQGSKIPGYQLYVETYKGNDNLQLGQATNTSHYKRITETVLPFSPDNIHRFDLSQICKSFVSTPLPNLSMTGSSIAGGYILPFAFAYGEQFSMVPGTNTIKKIQKGILNHVYVANASLPITQPNSLSSYSGNSAAHTVGFLTNQPAIKKTNKKQKELLYVLIPKDFSLGVEYYAFANVVYWDGSTASQKLFNLFTGSTNNGGLYEMRIGYESILYKFENSGKKLKSATIRVQSDYNSYSTTQTFQFGITEPKDRYGLLFKNSLGCYDVTDFYGSSEASVDRSYNTLTTPLQINQDGSVSNGFKYNSVYNTQLTSKIKVNSGWIDRNHFEWLKELLKSNEIYHYDDSGSLRYLKLDSPSYSENSNSTQFFVECTFIETMPDNTVTV